MPIEYLWPAILKAEIDKKGIKIELEKEKKEPSKTGTTATTPVPPKGEKAYPYPRPVAKDSLNIVLDESKFQYDEKTGKLVIPDVPIVKSVVQVYEDAGNVLKPSEDLENLVGTKLLNYLPITDGHPETDFLTAPNEVKGYLLNPRYSDGTVFCDLEVDDPSLVGDIRSGEKREVSLGFQSDMLDEIGELGGIAYGKTQRALLPDHLAIVKHGRCSLVDGCGITREHLAAAKETVDNASLIVDEAKTKLIDEMTALVPSLSKDKLVSKDMGILTTDLAYFKEAAKRSGTAEKFKGTIDQGSVRSKINEAYRSIGR